VGWDDIFKQTIQNNSLHEISNDEGVKMEAATSSEMLVSYHIRVNLYTIIIQMKKYQKNKYAIHQISPLNKVN
jgi:hypothetical protein